MRRFVTALPIEGYVVTSTIAWLDYDSEQQRATQRMLDALSERTAVDGLGLGVLRDLISNVLHPGMSVLHTRARYLLFVPWAYRDIRATTARGAVEAGRKAEVQTAKALVAHYSVTAADSFGIIGRRKLDDMSRLPSVAYWPLLRRLGVLKFDGSVAAYCQSLASSTAAHGRRQIFRDADDVQDQATDLWVELPPTPPEWPAVSFDLRVGEAKFLVEQIAASDLRARGLGGSESLLSWLARQSKWTTGVSRPWLHPDAAAFPIRTGEIMEFGRLLDVLMHGARILYNLLCAKGAGRDDLVARFENNHAAWRNELDNNGLPKLFPAKDFWSWAVASKPRSAALEAARTFVIPAQLHGRLRHQAGDQ